MPGFEDSAFIVLLALLLFGPKKLPELARQLGKLMADFRRASSEFRAQMEDELRISEQAERQKKLAASSASELPSAESTGASSVVTPTVVPALDPAQAEAAEAAYANQDLPPLEDSYAPQASIETAITATPETDKTPDTENMTPGSAHKSTEKAAPKMDFKASTETDFKVADESAPAPNAVHVATSAEAVAPVGHASESEHLPELLHG